MIIPKYKADLLSTDTGEIPVTIEANLLYEEQDVNSSLDTSFDIEGLPFLEKADAVGEEKPGEDSDYVIHSVHAYWVYPEKGFPK